MKKFLSIVLALVCFLLPLAACKKGITEKKEYETRTKTVSYVHFNTVSTISSYGDTTAEEFEEYVKIADETHPQRPLP